MNFIQTRVQNDEQKLVITCDINFEKFTKNENKKIKQKFASYRQNLNPNTEKESNAQWKKKSFLLRLTAAKPPLPNNIM